MSPVKHEPIFSEPLVTVCLASSNEYSPFVCVTVKSVVENSSPDVNYDINILNDNISPKNKKMIASCAGERKNISIRFIDASEYLNGQKFYVWGPFNQYTYYRLLIPDIFSAYEKVLYLDSDIIVCRDAAELFKLDMGENVMAAARDTHVIGRLYDRSREEENRYYYEVVDVRDSLTYYQCGVSLYNIGAIRQSFGSGYLVKEASGRTLRWMDQDLINIVFKGKVMLLENKWNVMVINNPRVIDEDFLPEKLKTEYYEAKKDPYIVHFVGKSMPFYNPYIDFYDLYWKYARQTPYYENLIYLMIRRAIHMEKTALIAQIKTEKSFKYKVKNKLVKPVVNVFLPRGSKRRERVRQWYLKIFHKK